MITILNKNKIFTLLVILLIGLLAACGGNSGDTGDAVAIVNGEEIPREDFDLRFEQTAMQYEAQMGMDITEDDEMREQVEQSTLEQLINERIVIIEARNEGYEAEDEEVTEQIEMFRQQADMTEGISFEDMLEDAGLTEDELFALIAESIAAQKYIEDQIDTSEFGDVEVTEQEIEEMIEMAATYDFELSAEEAEMEIVNNKMQQWRGEQEQALIERLRANSDIEILL